MPLRFLMIFFGACASTQPAAHVMLAPPPQATATQLPYALKQEDDLRGCTRLALVLVVDRSSAMTSDAMLAVRNGSGELIDQAGEADCIGVVTFASDAVRALDLSVARRHDTAKRAVDTISMSNTSGRVLPAIDMAWQLLRHAPKEAKRAILLIAASPSLDHDATTAKAIAAEGIILSAVRLPGGDDALRTFADDGGGRFYSVGAVEYVGRVMTREMEMIISPPTEDEED